MSEKGVSLLDIKVHMRNDMRETVLSIELMYKRMETYAVKVEESIKNYMDKGYVPHTVADKIVNGVTANRNESLQLIHQSMYRTQDLLTFLKIDILPRITEIHSDVKSILKASKINARNNDKFLNIKISATQRKDELEFVTVDVDMAASNVQKMYTKIKDYIMWVEGQMDYLNRLDSMIRLSQRIDENVLANSSNTGSFSI